MSDRKNELKDVEAYKRAGMLAAKGYKREEIAANLSLEFDDELTREQASEIAANACAAVGPLVGSSDHVPLAENVLDRAHACMHDGRLYVWHNGSYTDDDKHINNEIRVAQPSIVKSRIEEVRFYLRDNAPEAESAHPRYIAFDNGYFDLETGALEDATPDLFVPNGIPHSYNANPDEQSLEFVRRWMTVTADGIEQTERNLWEIMGYAMYRDSWRLQQFFLLVGDGDNGKSVFIKTLRLLVGARNYCTTDPTGVSGAFGNGRMPGKLLWAPDDIGSDKWSPSTISAIKKLTSGTSQESSEKYAVGADFAPKGLTTVISCNNVPHFADCDNAWMKRICPIVFSHSFAPGSPDRIEGVEDRLAERGAMEAIVYLATEALRAHIESGASKLSHNDGTEQLKSELRVSNDYALEFIQSTGVTEDELVGRPTFELAGKFEKWLDESVSGGARLAYKSENARKRALSAAARTSFSLKTEARTCEFNNPDTNVMERRQTRCWVRE